MLDSYLILGAEYNLKPGKSPFEMPENLWKALKYSREWRLGLIKAEQDQKDGTVSLVNEDAYPEG